MLNGSFLKWKSWIVFVFVMGFLFGFGGYSYGGKIKSFSATQVFMDANGQIQYTGKAYVASRKARMDGVAPDGKGRMINIVRRDLKVHWTLNPEKKTYFERVLTEDETQGSMEQIFKGGKEQDLGYEKVSGYKCRKKRIETTSEFMGFKRKSHSIVWVSDKFDMPLRTESSDGSVTELRNIKKEMQSKKLFELPDGYIKVSNIFELFGSPSEGEGPQSPVAEGKEEGEEIKIPEEVRKMLPKGFKLPSGGKK